MKFEELSQIWNQSDGNWEEQVQLNRKLVKQAGVSKIKASLLEIKWEALFEIVAGVFFLQFLAKFTYTHFADLQYSIPALILLNIALFGVLFEGLRLFLYFSLNANDPVVTVQQKLARLRYWEIIDIYSLLVIIPLFSAPFFIVMAKHFLDINLYEFNLSWLVQYTIGSVVVAVILVVVFRLFPNKRLTEAMAFMRELKEE
ncbi:MAG: hypothetical protein KDD99_20060 [Bacteroidetes bacterium]|nr:hypothetical protein [Bacteroidota bacterium]